MPSRTFEIQLPLDDRVFKGAVFHAEILLPHRMTSSGKQLFVEIEADDFTEPAQRDTAITLIASVPGLASAVIDRLTAEGVRLDGTTGLHLYVRRAPGTPVALPDVPGYADRLRALTKSP